MLSCCTITPCSTLCCSTCCHIVPSHLAVHCVVAFWITISITVLCVGFLLKIKTGLSIGMRWSIKKQLLLFFSLFGRACCKYHSRFLIFLKKGQTQTKTTQITMMRIWPTWLANYPLLTKRQGERPYLIMASISRVFCLNQERLSSFTQYAMYPCAGVVFLPSLHRDVGIISVVKRDRKIQYDTNASIIDSAKNKARTACKERQKDLIV